ADKAAKEAARRHLPGKDDRVRDSFTSLAFIKRHLTHAKWAASRRWTQKRTTKGNSYVPPKKIQPDPALFSAPKGIASRLMQLRTGHALISTYCKKRHIGGVTDDTCRWCKRYPESREHLFRHCPRWRMERKDLEAAVKKEAKTHSRVKTWNMARFLAEPTFTPALLQFLKD
ncbi:hypothetical protein FN846DRAFT_752558, partial [Sphaerosporella brunnea]